MKTQEKKQVDLLINNLIEIGCKYSTKSEKDEKTLLIMTINFSQEQKKYFFSEMEINNLLIQGRKADWSEEMHEINNFVLDFVESKGNTNPYVEKKTRKTLRNKKDHVIQVDINFKNLTLNKKKLEKSNLDVSVETMVQGTTKTNRENEKVS